MNRILFFFLFSVFLYVSAFAKYNVKVLSKATTLASQLNEANTKYIIQEDLLIDSDVTIPENCIIQMNGGTISGPYILRGNNTQIESGMSQIFGTDIHFAGTWNISEIYPEWFGAIPNVRTGDCSIGIQKAIEFSCTSSYSKVVKFQGGRYYCKHAIKLIGGKDYYLQADGNATLVASGREQKYLLGRDGTNSSDAIGLRLNIRDVTFDANYRCDFCVYMPLMSNSTWYNVNCISARLCNYFTNYSFIDNFYGCKFLSGDPYGYPTKFAIYMGTQACNAMLFSGCSFEGAYIGAYSDNGYNVVFSSCTFEGLRSTGLYVNRTECCSIENCYFEDVSWHRETVDKQSPRFIDPSRLGVTFTKCKRYLNNTSNNGAIDYSMSPFKMHGNIIQNNEVLAIDCDLQSLTLGFREISKTNPAGRQSGRMIIVRGNTFQHIKTKGVQNDCNVFSCGSECMQVYDNSFEAIDIIKGMGKLYEDYKPQNIIIANVNGMSTSKSYSSYHNANHSEIDDNIVFLNVTE